MNRYYSYIASAAKIIKANGTGKPLSIHIRSFFAADKKYGSKDRRTIASLCYYYFRTGKAFSKNTIEEKILYGLFLCENESDPLLGLFYPDLNSKIKLSLTEKFAHIGIKEEDIFPFSDEIGSGIDKHSFALSFLRQPDIFLRIRPGKKAVVIDKLNEAAIEFELLGNHAIKLPANIAADKILQLNREAVVQDINSQKVLDYLDAKSLQVAQPKITAWDCCAASGGKSILLYDKLKGNVELVVSDIRESILANLKTRLQQAGVPVSKSLPIDLSVTAADLHEKFSIIICDVPCTGSGTWSRSPEQLYFFKKKMIGEYVIRQQNIISNTVSHLDTNGLFFYITCSVFKRENEEMVAFMQEKFKLQLLKMQYLKGYETGADTMFVAVFTRQ